MIVYTYTFKQGNDAVLQVHAVYRSVQSASRSAPLSTKSGTELRAGKEETKPTAAMSPPEWILQAYRSNVTTRMILQAYRSNVTTRMIPQA